MEIIYIISVLIILISFILLKKSKKELDLINCICWSIVILFCYNTFICFILTFFAIRCRLWILTAINLLISIVFIIRMLKDKEIQKFIIKKIDIVYVVLICIVVGVIAYIYFGFPFEVNYETGDPSVHYLTSLKFAKEETLMPNCERDQIYGDLSARKPVSYVNSGLLIKCLNKDIDPMDCYKIFASFSTFILALTGVSLYTALKHFSKNEEHNFWTFIVTLICLLGYPLNSFLFGFEYFSMGLLVLISIIDMIYYFNNKSIKYNYIVIILALLSFGLFFSYYMFVPFIYPALWIYFHIRNCLDTNKLITKKLIGLWLVILLVPFFLGYLYHLAPKVYAIIINQRLDMSSLWDQTNYIAGEGFAVEGYIYTNIYSNMLLLLPLTAYYFIKKIKDKTYEDELFLFLVTICTILFIEILLAGNSVGKISSYYLSKNYFALWIILAFTNYKALVCIYDKSKYISRLFIYAYVILMMFCTAISNVKVEYYIGNPYENILSVMHIFEANKTILLKNPKEFTTSELEILKYVKNNLDLSSQIEFVTDENAYYWQYVLLNYVNKEEQFIGKPAGQRELTKKWVYLEEKINKVDYMVYFNKTERYKEMKDIMFEDAEIIYENESGGILKYKK